MIPAYNAAKYLPDLIRRCRQFVCDENFLIVNDGSTDDSLRIIKESGVNYISFPQNQGKGAALKAGFDYAVKHGYRSVLTLDADLQHLPEEIPRFFALDNGRTADHWHPLDRSRHHALGSMAYQQSDFHDNLGLFHSACTG